MCDSKSGISVATEEVSNISITIEDADLWGVRSYYINISRSSHGREPEKTEGWITG